MLTNHERIQRHIQQSTQKMLWRSSHGPIRIIQERHWRRKVLNLQNGIWLSLYTSFFVGGRDECLGVENTNVEGSWISIL